MTEDVTKTESIELKIKTTTVKNCIEVYLPDGTRLENVPLIQDKYLFVPKNDIANLKNNRVYTFSINYFVDESKVGIIPNQPFVVDDHDSVNNPDLSHTKNVLDTITNPIMEIV